MARVLLAATVLVAVSPSRRLAAQASFAGSVVRLAGADTVPVPGAVIQLHRVSTVAQGVIDSTRTGARGQWRFRVRPETGASYLVSARYAGIEFFTPPLVIDAAHPDTALKIVVADTSSGPAARLTFVSRHFLVQGGDSAGWRGILDVMVFENRSRLTRVASDTTHPSYVALLPPDTHEPELADGDIGPEAVRFRNGSLEVYSPIAPGEFSVTVQYLLPSKADVAIPFGDTVATFNLLVDGEGAATTGPRLEGPTATTVEGRAFRRWTGPVPGGTVLQLDLRAAKKTPTALLIGLVIAMATALGAGLFVALRGAGVAKRVSAP